MKKHNCLSCENLNTRDASCAVLRENARFTTEAEKSAVRFWLRHAATPEVDGCPGYISDDPADYATATEPTCALPPSSALATLRSAEYNTPEADAPFDLARYKLKLKQHDAAETSWGGADYALRRCIVKIEALLQVEGLKAALLVANTETMEERAAVVAFLRREVPNRDTGLAFPPSVIIRKTLDEAAAFFEAGDHRRKVACARCTRPLSFEEQRDNGCVCFTCAEEE